MLFFFFCINEPCSIHTVVVLKRRIQDPFLLASLPVGLAQISEQSRVSFVVLLALFIVTDLVEVANLTIGVPRYIYIHVVFQHNK